MLNVADLVRRLSSAVARAPSKSTQCARLTTEDVLWAMGPRGDEELSRFGVDHGTHMIHAIDASLASLPRIVADEDLVRQRPGYSRYFEVLPRLMYLSGRGHSSDEIAAAMTFMATGRGVDAVLRMTAEAIARRVNRLE